MTALRQTWQVYLRGVRVFIRQPAYLGMTLIQPIIWLLLFGALFKAVTQIPGFHGSSYIDFLTPGVVVMLAVFSAGWVGMGFIDDIHSGVMDRMLASPVWRGALNAGTVAYGAAMVVVQTVLIVLLALVLGAHYRGGVVGVLLMILVAALLGAAFASLSNGVAVLARQRETLIGAVTLVQLPLTFLSAALMQQSLAPGWIQSAAKFNPVNWAVVAARGAAMQKTDWGLVAGRLGLLAALTLRLHGRSRRGRSRNTSGRYELSAGSAGRGDDRQPRHEEVRERADPERVGDRPDADGAAEQPAGHEHGDLDARADDPNRMAARGQAGHQAVARPGAEPGADVCAGGDAVEDHATGHQTDLERQPVGGRERHEHQVDHRPDHEDVGDRPEARTLVQRNPQQHHARADDQRPGADAEAEMPRQPLMKDVPWVHAEAGQQQHPVADPVQHEPDVELGQATGTGWGHHAASLAQNGMDSSGPIW